MFWKINKDNIWCITEGKKVNLEPSLVWLVEEYGYYQVANPKCMHENEKTKKNDEKHQNHNNRKTVQCKQSAQHATHTSATLCDEWRQKLRHSDMQVECVFSLNVLFNGKFNQTFPYFERYPFTQIANEVFCPYLCWAHTDYNCYRFIVVLQSF